MTESILKSIDRCNEGYIKINHGIMRAFAFKRKCYPLRAVINDSLQESNKEEKTTNRALVELAYLHRYIRIADINFQDNYPIDLTTDEIFAEIKILSAMISDLVEK